VSSPSLAGRTRRLTGDAAFRWLLRGCGAAVLVVLALMIGTTTWQAWPIFMKSGLHFFIGSDWSPGSSSGSTVTGTYGALPFIYGTVVSSLIALVIGVPLSIGVAITLVEIAPARLARPLSSAVDLLAAVPSVIYGLWGVLFFVPVVLRPLMNFASTTLGFIPIFKGPVWSTNYFAAGVVLAIMTVPIIAAIAREIFRAVPDGERYAAYALGATHWEVIRYTVLPRSRAGLVGASMLGLGRALGETIAVALLIGGGLKIDVGIFHPGYSIAALIANTFQEATPEGVKALIAIGVTLFGITVLINMLARLIVWRFGDTPASAASL
jgi:phosphate transport system permease protein